MVGVRFKFCTALTSITLLLANPLLPPSLCVQPASSPAVSIFPTVTAAASETQNVIDRENNDTQANMDTNGTEADETVAQDLPAMPRNQWIDQRTRQTPVDILERHLQDLDPKNIFNIANASQNQLGPDTGT